MPPSQPSCSEQSDYQRAVGRVVSPLTRRFGAAALGHPGSRWERGAPSGLPCASAQWPFQRLAASSPRKEGGYLGFLCVWGGTPPTSLHEEGASFQACAAMPQIPKPACFRCTVPVTLWMEPFRPLVQLSGLVPLRKQVVRHRTDHAAPWGGPLCVPIADRAAKEQLESGGSPPGCAPVNRVLASSQEHHFTNEIPKIPLEWQT